MGVLVVPFYFFVVLLLILTPLTWYPNLLLSYIPFVVFYLFVDTLHWSPLPFHTFVDVYFVPPHHRISFDPSPCPLIFIPLIICYWGGHLLPSCLVFTFEQVGVRADGGNHYIQVPWRNGVVTLPFFGGPWVGPRQNIAHIPPFAVYLPVALLPTLLLFLVITLHTSCCYNRFTFISISTLFIPIPLSTFNLFIVIVGVRHSLFRWWWWVVLGYGVMGVTFWPSYICILHIWPGVEMHLVSTFPISLSGAYDGRYTTLPD